MYEPWIEAEKVIPGPLRKGDAGEGVKRLQEHLSLAGSKTAVDGVFGPATGAALRNWQAAVGLEQGVADQASLDMLTGPIRQACGLLPLPPEKSAPALFPFAVAQVAERHLRYHPREVGGENRGPWVRLYMNGRDGSHLPWCAGFVSFVLKQAAESHGADSPLEYTWSCDLMAQDAMEKRLFVAHASGDDEAYEGLVEEGRPAIFLVLGGEDDWTHTGIVQRFEGDHVVTIEGNTNDEGSREGYEVCRRFRSPDQLDFIVLGE